MLIDGEPFAHTRLLARYNALAGRFFIDVRYERGLRVYLFVFPRASIRMSVAMTLGMSDSKLKRKTAILIRGRLTIASFGKRRRMTRHIVPVTMFASATLLLCKRKKAF